MYAANHIVHIGPATQANAAFVGIFALKDIKLQCGQLTVPFFALK